MAKKNSVEGKIDALTNIVEKGFAAVAEDIASVKRDIGTIHRDMIDLHTQVSSIEQQFRQTRTDIRLGDLEEKVFGKARG